MAYREETDRYNVPLTEKVFPPDAVRKTLSAFRKGEWNRQNTKKGIYESFRQTDQ